MCLPAMSRDDPGADLPRRIVAHVLGMSALQVGHPLPFVILMKSDDATLHVRPHYQWSLRRQGSEGEEECGHQEPGAVR
jgi:hypothetical protein